MFPLYKGISEEKGGLDLKRDSKHRSASAEAVVIAVGVHAIEHGVGIAALVQQVGELQTEDGLLQLILR